MNTIVRVRNTEENRKHLDSIGIYASPKGSLLEIEVNDYHEMRIGNGQMSIASYKKNVLGL
jgi:hypothetical protein